MGNERLARATVDGDTVTIHNLRDFRYVSKSEVQSRWIDDTFDLRELTNLWVYFVQFSKIRAIAHTEVAFEFADGRVVVASFEIRALKGQRYSPIAGMGKNFEMSLRWMTERDPLTRRIAHEGKSRTFMFLADITQKRIVELFHAFAARTNELHDEPEWYHSVNNACTTSIMDVVHQALPGQVARSGRAVLPGTLPKYWARHGILKFEGDFDDAWVAAEVTERIREIGDVEDFSLQLHQRGKYRPR